MNQFPLILYHIQNHKKEKQIKNLCKKLSICTRALKASDSNLEIGVLTGIGQTGVNTHKKAPEDYQLFDILIFSGFSEELLDTFLADYKAAGIEQIGLKAVVTSHNLTWTVYELTAELVREQTAMILGGRKGNNGKKR